MKDALYTKSVHKPLYMVISFYRLAGFPAIAQL